MKRYSFTAHGHENILGKHRNTIEFTKDTHLSKNGDCIIGVRADFDSARVRELIAHSQILNITISLGKELEPFVVRCRPNPEFASSHEVVIRRSAFASERTLGISSDKACNDIPRSWIPSLQNPDQLIHVTIEAHHETAQQERD